MAPCFPFSVPSCSTGLWPSVPWVWPWYWLRTLVPFAAWVYTLILFWHLCWSGLCHFSLIPCLTLWINSQVWLYIDVVGDCVTVRLWAGDRGWKICTSNPWGLIERRAMIDKFLLRTRRRSSHLREGQKQSVLVPGWGLRVESSTFSTSVSPPGCSGDWWTLIHTKMLSVQMTETKIHWLWVGF